MTPERAKELLPIITAFAEEKEVEEKPFGGSGWRVVRDTEWDNNSKFRIKGSEKLRPFTQLEACKFRFYRDGVHGEWQSPEAIQWVGIRLRNGWIPFDNADGWQCSIDGVTWQRCGVEE
jgi:hypothetical protein